MKKMVILIMVLIVGASSLASRRTPQAESSTINSRLVATGEDKLSLFIKSQNVNAAIRLEDSAGNVIYRNTVFSKTKVEVPFDLSLLKTGEYRFTIKIGNKEVKKTFFLRTKTMNTVEIAG